MPWYRTGTVAITAGQTTVTGTGTNFSANARVGDALMGPDGNWYEVTNIASGTVLSILPAYKGATVSGGTYAITPVQGYTKTLADKFNDIATNWGSTLSGLGSVSTENVVPVAKGGTGSTTAAGARTALGLGTAATVTMTTSTTDNAAGRGLKVGDHGLGVSLGTLPTGAALDSLVAHSLFSSQDAAPPDWNTPASSSVYPMGINFYRSAVVRAQAAMGYAGTARGKFRYRTMLSSGSWSDWGDLLAQGDYSIGISTALDSTVTTWQGNKFTGWSSTAPDSPFGTNAVGLDMGYATDRRMQIAVSTGNGFFYRYANTPDGQQNWSQVISSYNAHTLPITQHLAASGDNTQQLGVSARRWSVVFAATGTINTSDAREKTEVRPLSAAEIAAAKDLGKEIGAYRWLASVQEKGVDAREHIGMTVQRAIQIMEAHGLDPFNYGFICFDKWDDEWEDVPAVEEVIPADPVYAIEVIEDPVTGDPIETQVQTNAGETKVVTIQPATRRLITAAGDRYSFRYDGLNLFIAAGLEARLAALEASMG